jgi:hypothetical protein
VMGQRERDGQSFGGAAVELRVCCSSCRRRGRRRCRGRRCSTWWRATGRGPRCTCRCCGRGRGRCLRGVITGPSAGGDQGDDDGSDDEERHDRDSYPLAAALLLGTVAIRPVRSVPVSLDLGIAARVRVPARRLRRTRRLALVRTSDLLGPGAAIPVTLAGGRIVRICVPTGLSPFDQVNSSPIAARPH